MTVVVGGPDWGDAIQAPVVAVNQTISTSPVTITADVARWPFSYLELTQDPAGGALTTLSVAWLDIAGVPLLDTFTNLATVPAEASATLRFMVKNLGVTASYTITGVNTTCRFVVTHQPGSWSVNAPATPNMTGATLFLEQRAYTSSQSRFYTMRGTGNHEAAGGIGYVGPAILVAGTDGNGAAVQVTDANGIPYGGVLVGVTGATGAPTSSAGLMIPAAQYYVAIQAPGSGATISTRLYAAA